MTSEQIETLVALCPWVFALGVIVGYSLPHPDRERRHSREDRA